MLTIDRNGRKLEYEVSGEGPALVFLHGLGGSVNQIKSLYDAIPGVKLIVPNQQGHGESVPDWEHFGFDSLADDVIALLDCLGIKKAVIAGISMGAAVSLNLAVRYPSYVQKLILIRNVWSWEAMSADRQKAYDDLGRCLECYQESTDDDWKLWIEHFWSTEGGKNVKAARSTYTENAFSLPFREDYNVLWNKKYSLLPPQIPVSNREEIERIMIPTLVIACKNDFCHPFECSEKLYHTIPGSEIIEIPSKDEDGKRHQEMINSSIRRFLFKDQNYRS